MKKLTHILVALCFAFSCLGLWAMLSALGSLSTPSSQALPAFTAMLVGLRGWLLVLPIPVAAYCVFGLIRPSRVEPSGTTYLAGALSALCLVTFPVLLGVLLPCVKLMDQAWDL